VAILELSGVSKHFGAIQALIDVSLTLHEGEVVGLMGDNGAGKSTLVKIIAGNFRPTHGSMRMEGADLILHRPIEARQHGIEIVRKAIQTPARQIATNAGADGSVVVGKLLEKDQYSYGYDAQNGEYGNLMTKGIIDPTKVVRAAIQNAASVAGLLITTEAMVAEVPKKQNAAPAMPGGGGMGGMDF